mmetsp:Transcript_7695/g.19631  ORF Transcript_7695/g.19631 Transcript_7695/m.19631 type:complete len:134 (-) Transcript_7695:434-835(-)
MVLQALVPCLTSVSALAIFQDPRKPIETDRALLCHACRAIVHQTDHKFRHLPKRSTADVIDFLDEVCNVKYLKIYESIPPKMKKGCEDFLATHGGAYPGAARLVLLLLTRQALNTHRHGIPCLPRATWYRRRD